MRLNRPGSLKKRIVTDAENLLGAQDHVAVVGSVLASFAFLSAISGGVRDAIDYEMSK